MVERILVSFFGVLGQRIDDGRLTTSTVAEQNNLVIFETSTPTILGTMSKDIETLLLLGWKLPFRSQGVLGKTDCESSPGDQVVYKRLTYEGTVQGKSASFLIYQGSEYNLPSTRPTTTMNHEDQWQILALPVLLGLYRKVLTFPCEVETKKCVTDTSGLGLWACASVTTFCYSLNESWSIDLPFRMARTRVSKATFWGLTAGLGVAEDMAGKYGKEAEDSRR